MMFDIQKSPKTYARFSGLLYLLIAISGGFSMGYVPSVIIDSGDAAATTQNILNNPGLFRLAILGDIVVLLFEVVLTVMLYQLFKPINRTLSLVAAFSRLAMAMVMGVNLLNYLVPLQLLSGSEYFDVFEPAQMESLALLFLECHQYGVYIWGLFFGLHLIALGYLVFQSGYFPKVLGLLMMIGSFGYSFESMSAITQSTYETLSMFINLLLVIAVVGELSFTFWLLIKSIDVDKLRRINKQQEF
jgi:hypothetical protein